MSVKKWWWEDPYVNKDPITKRIEDAKVGAQQASTALHELTGGGGLVSLAGNLSGISLALAVWEATRTGTHRNIVHVLCN